MFEKRAGNVNPSIKALLASNRRLLCSKPQSLGNCSGWFLTSRVCICLSCLTCEVKLSKIFGFQNPGCIKQMDTPCGTNPNQQQSPSRFPIFKASASSWQLIPHRSLFPCSCLCPYEIVFQRMQSFPSIVSDGSNSVVQTLSFPSFLPSESWPHHFILQIAD